MKSMQDGVALIISIWKLKSTISYKFSMDADFGYALWMDIMNMFNENNLL